MITREEIFRGVQHCIDANADRGIAVRAGNVACQIHVEQDRALAVFAGSNDGKDWIRNLTIARSRVPGLGAVHLGFWQCWLTIESALRRYLDDHAPGRPVDLRGHSQGGALAQVAAVQMGRPIRSVVTFGAPRCFDDEAAAAYGGVVPLTRRVVVGWDAVPRWPKNHMGYVHAGPGVFLLENGRQVKEQERPKWYRRPWEYVWAAVDNHFVANEYYRAVRDWARQGGAA